MPTYNGMSRHVRRGVTHYLIAIYLLALILGLFITYWVTKNEVDTIVSGIELGVVAKIYSLSFQEENVTQPKFNNLTRELAGLEPDRVYGFLYIAQPGTEWVYRAGYININLFFGGFDSKYFAGFSIPRIQFFLASPDFNELGLDEPKDGEVLIVLDEKYRLRDDPIFEVVLDEKWLAFYYPSVLSINMTYTFIFMDTEPLRTSLGIPEEVSYDGDTYNFKRTPPIYLLVNLDTYVDILDITYPVVSGEVLRVEWRLTGFKDYLEAVTRPVSIKEGLEDIVYSLGIGDVDIIFLNTDELENAVRGRTIYSLYGLVYMVVVSLLATYLGRRARRRRSSLDTYVMLAYLLIVGLFIALLRIQYYVNLVTLLFYATLPVLVYLYITLKSRRRI